MIDNIYNTHNYNIKNRNNDFKNISLTNIEQNIFLDNNKINNDKYNKDSIKLIINKNDNSLEILFKKKNCAKQIKIISNINTSSVLVMP